MAYVPVDHPIATFMRENQRSGEFPIINENFGNKQLDEYVLPGPLVSEAIAEFNRHVTSRLTLVDFNKFKFFIRRPNGLPFNATAESRWEHLTKTEAQAKSREYKFFKVELNVKWSLPNRMERASVDSYAKASPAPKRSPLAVRLMGNPSV